MDNIQDMILKGRRGPSGVKGSGNGRAKLSERAAKEIKDLLLRGELSRQEIANLYGVHKSTVWRIAANKNWQHAITEEAA